MRNHAFHFRGKPPHIRICMCTVKNPLIKTAYSSVVVVGKEKRQIKLRKSAQKTNPLTKKTKKKQIEPYTTDAKPPPFDVQSLMKPYLLCMFAAFRYVTRARIRYECGFVHCARPTVFFLCPPERSLPGALASLVLYPARVLFF